MPHLVSSKKEDQRKGERRQTGRVAGYVGTDRRKLDRRGGPADAEVDPALH